MIYPKVPALKIRALAHDGSGIGFLDSDTAGRGKAVFVKGALPGQVVSCEIIREKERFSEARLLSVLASGFHADHECCPHWHECGGCPLQPMPYHTQLFWKEKLLRDALEKIGKLPPDSLNITWARPVNASAMPLLRNKVELAFGTEDSGELALGFRKRASHQVFQVRQCHLLSADALSIIAACKSSAQEFNISPQILRFLTLRKSAANLWTGILLTGPCGRHDKAMIRKLGERLLASQPAFEQFLHEERKKRDLLAIGDTRVFHIRKNGEKGAFMRMALCGREFQIDPSSFFQVNQAGAECLAEVVRSQDVLPGPLLDLYCGSGSPGQLLAGRHDSCLGIEQDQRAIGFATRNGRDLPGWRYFAGKVESVLSKEELKKSAFRTALIDPPRAGMASAALAELLRIGPELLIYVSCNPATLARDGGLLQKDYVLSSIKLVDMFPDTPHVECCTVWTRRDTI